MVQPFYTSYNGDDPEQTATATAVVTPVPRTPMATAPPAEGDFDSAAAPNTNLVEFILLGDRENYAIRADKSAIAHSNSELARIFESGGTTAVRLVGENRFAVTENSRANFELFIR